MEVHCGVVLVLICSGMYPDGHAVFFGGGFFGAEVSKENLAGAIQDHLTGAGVNLHCGFSVYVVT